MHNTQIKLSLPCKAKFSFLSDINAVLEDKILLTYRKEIW